MGWLGAAKHGDFNFMEMLLRPGGQSLSPLPIGQGPAG